MTLAVALPVTLWAVVGFALVHDEGWVETLIRLVLLVAVAVAIAWLLATGFDVRHPASPPADVAIRLAGVALLSAVALFLTSDAWVFGGQLGRGVSAAKQGLIAAVWLVALGGAVAYRRRSTPPLHVTSAARPTSAPPAATAPTPVGSTPPTRVGGVRQWPHLIVGLLVVGPLLVGEGLLLLLMAACGSDTGVVRVTLVVILSVLAGLPGVGYQLDRRRHRTLGAPAGFALAFGTMALVAFAHIVLVFVLLLLATAGYGDGGGC